MNEYSKYYQSLESLKIVSILRKANDYNAKSIQAAKNEMVIRNLDDGEMHEINQALDLADSKEVKSNLRQQEVKDKVKSKVNSGIKNSWKVIDVNQPNSYDLKIKVLATLVLVNGLVVLYSQWYIFEMVMSNELHRGIDISELLSFALVILPIIGGVLFWRKHKYGYYICFILMVLFLIAHIVVNLLFLFNYGFEAFPTLYSLSSFFVQLSLVSYGIMILLKPEVKEIYFMSEIGCDSSIQSDTIEDN